jgi:hypothetical protein
MKILTNLFRKPRNAVKSLVEELLGILANNSTIQENGKNVGFVGRDGFFTPLEDTANRTKEEKSDRSDNHF